ncbi:MAG: DUF2971 domain-containing protein [Gammaproteobacteria bacterium]|nr:DUF2971 domain-containing protein [Gammaproteobacteria bacterium]
MTSNTRKLYSYTGGNQEELCKYIDSLIAGKIWLSCPRGLNDPFELIGAVEFPEVLGHQEDRPDIYKIYLRSCLREGAVRPLLLPNELFTDLTPILNSDSSQPFSVAYLQRRLASLLTSNLNRIGLKCFTNDPLSTLMWAHYGKNYSGFCVEYEANLDTYEQQTKYLLEDVIYTTARQRLTLNEALFCNSAAIRKTMLTKGAEWAYERECRLITTSPMNVTAGAKGELRDLPAWLSVSTIYLGQNLPSCCRTRLEGYVKDNSGIELAKVMASSLKFALDAHFRPKP